MRAGTSMSQIHEASGTSTNTRPVEHSGSVASSVSSSTSDDSTGAPRDPPTAEGRSARSAGVVDAAIDNTDAGLNEATRVELALTGPDAFTASSRSYTALDDADHSATFVAWTIPFTVTLREPGDELF